MTASPSDWETVQRVILRLDIQRDEVYVEVVVMEVTLTKNFNFSANIASPNFGDRLPAQHGPAQTSSPTRSGATGAVLGFKAGSRLQTITIGNQTDHRLERHRPRQGDRELR